MKCLMCGSSNTKVIDSRLIDDRTKIKRRRQCQNCNYKFTTYEYYEKQIFYIVKPSGIKEKYDREKLRASLEICFAKRVEDSEIIIDEVIENFERKIEKMESSEIKSDMVEQIIMDELKTVDTIACVIYGCNACKMTSIEEMEMLVKYIKEGD